MKWGENFQTAVKISKQFFFSFLSLSLLIKSKSLKISMSSTSELVMLNIGSVSDAPEQPSRWQAHFACLNKENACLGATPANGFHRRSGLQLCLASNQGNGSGADGREEERENTWGDSWWVHYLTKANPTSCSHRRHLEAKGLRKNCPLEGWEIITKRNIDLLLIQPLIMPHRLWTCPQLKRTLILWIPVSPVKVESLFPQIFVVFLWSE